MMADNDDVNFDPPLQLPVAVPTLPPTAFLLTKSRQTPSRSTLSWRSCCVWTAGPPELNKLNATNAPSTTPFAGPWTTRPLS